MMQVVQMFAEGLQKQDCQLLAQGAQMFLQLVQQSQQGGAAPQEEQGQPVKKPFFHKNPPLSVIHTPSFSMESAWTKRKSAAPAKWLVQRFAFCTLGVFALSIYALVCPFSRAR